MKTKQKRGGQPLVVYAVALLIFIGALAICLFTVDKINRRMNESATANLLNTTLVIQDTLQSLLEKDMDALRVVGNFHQSEAHLTHEQIDALCQSMGFDWIVVADAEEKISGYPEFSLAASNLTFYEDWVPETEGYSNLYIGRTGRPQIGLWVPIFQDNQYIGTVFGGVILSKYYSANIFTFYEGAGRTYLFDGSNGDFILKSLGIDGTSTRQTNIYDLLSASENQERDITDFQQAVKARQSGTAVFDFNGENSFLCFLPLDSSPDWYVATVIAKDALLRESNEVQQMIQWVLVILCISLALAVVVFGVWRAQQVRTKETQYRDALFGNISANLDSSFLIYEKASRKTAFVSDNIKRLLGLDRDFLAKDAGRLFDWCRIPADDPQRIAFLEGTLSVPALREVFVENELGEESRVIRLELIPADLGQELAVLTDITKDKEIQHSLLDAMKRAEAASNAKNDFLSSMSHDLRTPINGVVGMTAIAAAHLDDKERVQDCLVKINESTAHLLSLINEVLDMSQIESGKIELTNEPFNLAELLQNVLNINYPGIQQKNHTVNVRVQLMEHENVIGDPTRLTRITENLISNAIKYTPANGTITLNLREKEPMIQGYGCYELIVQDNGIGMSPQFLDKLFDPFEREEDVRISRIQGTGLGMSIVKNIVELMMGHIEVESEKGKGTTFRTTVNLQIDEHTDEPANALTGLPVLVVDDDSAACEAVTNILNSIGMTGEWVDNGPAAIEMVVQRHNLKKDYLAVLLDWRMPGMDGMETARRIRAAVGAEVPIIIFTAYEWNQIEAEAREAGVNDFLTKPIYKAKLLQKMVEITTGKTEPFSSLNLPISGEFLAGTRVLLAEDNQLNKEIAVELLGMMGIETDCAENGAEAVELFASSAIGAYSMILMDIRMPKMNGYEATRMIRRMGREDSLTIPIVAMTADAFKKDEQLAREAGMNEHLSKPVSVERLTQVLLYFLQNTKKEDAHADETSNQTN